MNHAYYVMSRKTNLALLMPEEAIMTLLYHKEIEFSDSSHVGSDKVMRHYFKFKD